jgi:hypothetical protein
MKKKETIFYNINKSYEPKKQKKLQKRREEKRVLSKRRRRKKFEAQTRARLKNLRKKNIE